MIALRNAIGIFKTGLLEQTLVRTCRRRGSIAVLAVTLTFVATHGCRKVEEARAGQGAAAPAAALQTPAEPAGPPAPEVQVAVQAILDIGRHPALSWPELSGVLPDLKSLYSSESDGLVWFASESPHPALAGALETIARCDLQGLNPSDYDAGRLATGWERLRSGAAPADRASFDVAVSVAAIRLLQTVHRGRVDPRLVGFDYDVTVKRLDAAAQLRTARDHGGLADAVSAAEPQFPVYRRLVKALADYRALARSEPPAVPALPAGLKKLEPGKSWAGVPALAERMRAFGDLPGDAPAPAASADGTPLYEGPLVDAVKRFQGRHALEPDGVLGAGTLQVVNVPASARVHQIKLALERERWLPEMRREPHVFVNVPLFRLWAYEPAEPEEPLRMNVVAGKSLGHATPIFIDEMEYVIFRPYWSPPPSIIRAEILPHARRDPGYLERQNMEIVATGDERAEPLSATPENLDEVAAGRLFIRQKPGEKNSLGLAKFIFPNSDNVYMHGTPAQSLFSRARRDFSHGCIRLEEPARLAEWVLRHDPHWTPERIEAAMKGERPTQVNLMRKLRVMIFYDTAYVDSKGVVHFADDYYGHDARLEKALAGGYPYPRKSS
jgi:murein L,D-transpeptidase YcbB/YkuD